jgi:apolipoprotein N-acyltransferase
MGQKIIAAADTTSSAAESRPGLRRRMADFFTEQRFVLAGFILSAILLTLMQAPYDISLLAWAAWVPFILACGPKAPARRLMISAYLVGLLYWLSSLFWLRLVTWPGYIVFSVVFGLYWPLLAVGVRFVRRRGWPLFAVAPLLFVGAEAWQGYLLTGFHWYFLAHSQYANLPLIQICDLFGTLGVSVLLAAGNGLVAQFALSRRRIWTLGNLAGLAVTFALVTFAMVYGQYRLTQSPQFTTEGPLVGSVQPIVPSNVKEEIGNGPKILNDLIAESRQCIGAGAVMVAWPETMVLAPMNPEFLTYLEPEANARQYQQQILDHSKAGSAYILFGAPGADIGIRNGQYDIVRQYNSAFLYRPDGTPDPKRYDKIHLVPFGEYIPFKHSLPWVYKSILWLTPYPYDYTLTAGSEHTLFTMDSQGRTWNFGVLICYEDTDPSMARRHVLDKDGRKRTDWLVNLSNDGWYVRYKDKQVRPSVELAQRTAISVFRAVENRVSIIRSVNTGVSCLIEPTGRIRDGYRAGSLPKEALDRQGVAGWFVETIPVDSRITLFSRYGRWIDIVLGVGLAIILTWAVMDDRRQPSFKGKKT